MLQNISEQIQGRSYKGEIEFIIKDKHGRVVETRKEPNIIKIFAKESLSHRIVPDRVWDPQANSGSGDWINNTIVNLTDFSLKYIVFGASFDADFAPLNTTDPRFYIADNISGGTTPIMLSSGAQFDGGLINPIPISEPGRPLKRVERVFFEPSYQPAGTPLLQSDVRAVNNIVVFETVLRKEEYNGMGGIYSDHFTITEVALVAGPEIGSVGTCGCDPHSLFLEGDVHGYPLTAQATGSPTISLDLPNDTIKEGDQVRISNIGDTLTDTLDQISPYYLVLSKVGGGRDIVLDRTPVLSDNLEILGPIGVMKDSFRIFSHRILKVPLLKSADYEITTRWSIILN